MADPGSKKTVPPLDVERKPAGSTTGTDDGPMSPAQEAEKARRLSSTAGWKPAMDRRTSYDKQEFKREMQMTGLDSEKKAPGFSERKN